MTQLWGLDVKEALLMTFAQALDFLRLRRNRELEGGCE